MLREACAQAATWRAGAGRAAAPFVSINISPQQFLQPEFLDRVQAALMESGVAPAAVRTLTSIISSAISLSVIVSSSLAWLATEA